jgi:hypothetical protein
MDIWRGRGSRGVRRGVAAGGWASSGGGGDGMLEGRILDGKVRR